MDVDKKWLFVGVVEKMKALILYIWKIMPCFAGENYRQTTGMENKIFLH